MTLQGLIVLEITCLKEVMFDFAECREYLQGIQGGLNSSNFRSQNVV